MRVLTGGRQEAQARKRPIFEDVVLLALGQEGPRAEVCGHFQKLEKVSRWLLFLKGGSLPTLRPQDP